MRITKICLCFTFIVILLCACSHEGENTSAEKDATQSIVDLDVLNGIWSLDAYTKYSFDGLGSGELILSADTYVFSYTIDEDILFIDFESSSAKDSVYQFKIDKNTLTLNSQDNNKGTFVLTRN